MEEKPEDERAGKKTTSDREEQQERRTGARGPGAGALSSKDRL